MAPAMAPRAHRHQAPMLAERVKEGFDKGKHWRTRRDSNPQPSDSVAMLSLALCISPSHAVKQRALCGELESVLSARRQIRSRTACGDLNRVQPTLVLPELASLSVK
jgi:hypothetical protein